jgi:hypothetical protein
MLMLLEGVSMQKKKGMDIIPSSTEEQGFCSFSFKCVLLHRWRKNEHGSRAISGPQRRARGNR